MEVVPTEMLLVQDPTTSASLVDARAKDSIRSEVTLWKVLQDDLTQHFENTILLVLLPQVKMKLVMYLKFVVQIHPWEFPMTMVLVLLVVPLFILLLWQVYFPVETSKSKVDVICAWRAPNELNPSEDVFVTRQNHVTVGIINSSLGT